VFDATTQDSQASPWADAEAKETLNYDDVKFAIQHFGFFHGQ
jgi:hypothetical protein